ncbi:Structure-specific endonuclease subunit slx1 [Porphyridium purpureum]|uniref:Structure-specific endonuclease subunit slx1 n=1 Tax=Porphyridium purpureum TaxID=35688 RepID=A0A5J4YM56_PORPP|nr:Structure-specific endonuclease subunit slx1 [Porphyridium purpureum]|eukprot:POR4113..scf244_11
MATQRTNSIRREGKTRVEVARGAAGFVRQNQAMCEKLDLTFCGSSSSKWDVDVDLDGPEPEIALSHRHEITEQERSHFADMPILSLTAAAPRTGRGGDAAFITVSEDENTNNVCAAVDLVSETESEASYETDGEFEHAMRCRELEAPRKHAPLRDSNAEAALASIGSVSPSATVSLENGQHVVAACQTSEPNVHVRRKYAKEYFGCYLIQSYSSKRYSKNRTYIGFTNDVVRRLKQHNGLISGGAKKTTAHRPWRLICIIVGFSHKQAGLQFEWAWQHPADSIKFDEASALAGSRLVPAAPQGQRSWGNSRWMRSQCIGVPRRLEILAALLQSSAWNCVPLDIFWRDEVFKEHFSRTASNVPSDIEHRLVASEHEVHDPVMHEYREEGREYNGGMPCAVCSEKALVLMRTPCCAALVHGRCLARAICAKLGTQHRLVPAMSDALGFLPCSQCSTGRQSRWAGFTRERVHFR